jgi:hypothetical protein
MDMVTKMLYAKENPDLSYFIERIENSSNNKIMEEILEHKQDYKHEAFYLLIKEARLRGLIKYDTGNTVIIITKAQKQLIIECAVILGIGAFVGLISGYFVLCCMLCILCTAVYARFELTRINNMQHEDSINRIEEVDPFLEYRYNVTKKVNK